MLWWVCQLLQMEERLLWVCCNCWDVLFSGKNCDEISGRCRRGRKPIACFGAQLFTYFYGKVSSLGVFLEVNIKTSGEKGLKSKVEHFF